MTGAILIEDIEASRACVNVQHQGTGATALMAAAGKGRLEDAAALLTAGADPLLKSNDGSTAQDWADRFGHEDLAEFLGSHMQVWAPFAATLPPCRPMAAAEMIMKYCLEILLEGPNLH